jgi:hypothetical protein
MHMMARWKDNFINFNMEGCFNTFSVLEEKIKTVENEATTKDDIEVGDDDMTNDWNHSLMMIRKS